MVTINRTTGRLSSFSRAPPPSPIPTGKGSRSSVGPDLSEYIDKSKEVPELILPGHAHRLVPADIEYQLLTGRVRDDDAVNRLVRSAAELGAFRISGHGICTDELRSILVENEVMFGVSPHFVWGESNKVMMELVKDVLGELQFQIFSEKINNAGRELEAIAKEIGHIFNPSDDYKPAQRDTESNISSTLTLHTYTHQIPHAFNTKSHKDSTMCAFSLNLVLEPGEFSVQLERGRVSFTTSPDTIIVTLGEQFKEGRLGEFKSAEGELIFKPNLYEHQEALFSIELNWSFPNLFNNNNNNNNKNNNNTLITKPEKTISLTDQLLILIFAIFLFKIFAFICS